MKKNKENVKKLENKYCKTRKYVLEYKSCET